MKTDRPVGAAATAAVAAVGIVACCGTPVLLSLGGITIAGLGLRSWAVAVSGLLVVVIAGGRLRRHRACKATRPAVPQGGASDARRSRTR